MAHTVASFLAHVIASAEVARGCPASEAAKILKALSGDAKALAKQCGLEVPDYLPGEFHRMQRGDA